MTLIRLALASLGNRRTVAGLTILSIAFSVALLLTVEHLRRDARTAFANTVSGTDLIVGAPIGDVQLLLQTIFRIGHSGGGVSWERFEAVHDDPRVAWAVPIALGDSYRGYPVVGTTKDYFEHYQVGQRQSLRLKHGQVFAAPTGAVVGAHVASTLNLTLRQGLVLTHGRGEIDGEHHDDAPFTVVGILARTGTPVDRAIHISLDGVARMHSEEHGFKSDPLAALKSLRQDEHQHEAEKGTEHHENESAEEHHKHEADEKAEHHENESAEEHHKHEADEKAEHHEDESAEEHHKHEAHKHAEHHEGESAGDHEPINAFLVGLNRKTDLLSLQRELNETKIEPTQAVIPGVALQQLWDIFAVAEDLLWLMSWLVVIGGLISMLIVIVASLESRRREMSVLRAVGASPAYVGGLFVAEAALLASVGIALGVLLKYAAQLALSPWVTEWFGVQLPQSMLIGTDWLLLLMVWLAAVLVALIPALRAMRLALGDGLLMRS